MFAPLRRTFDFSGTSGRPGFYGYLAFYFAAATALFIGIEAAPTRELKGIAVFFVVLLFLPVPALAARRLHDAGWNGAWAWLLVVPTFGLAIIALLGALRPKPDQNWPKRKRHWGGRIGLIALVAAALVRVFYEPFWIPSGSMKPTLLPGDYVLMPLRDREYQRGDVIFFRHPVIDQIMVGRVVGGYLDHIQMWEGQIIHKPPQGSEISRWPFEANGTFSESFERQAPTGSFPICKEGMTLSRGAACTKDRFTEQTPEGRRYDTLSIAPDRRGDTTGLYVVPPERLFILGDNRDNASDSRFEIDRGGWGYVPRANVIGRADLVLFSAGGRALWDITNWRFDRFFVRVNP